jgi:hypothetical protein
MVAENEVLLGDCVEVVMNIYRGFEGVWVPLGEFGRLVVSLYFALFFLGGGGGPVK